VIPATLVDALPERFWWTGNDYLVFGRFLHLCVAPGGNWTVELDGAEIGRGHRSIRDFAHPPDERTRDHFSEIDLGWTALASAIAIALLMAAVRRRS